jgi:glycosyltransferase involved in cell wall biosynthesis
MDAECKFEVASMRILHLLNHTARHNGHVHAAVDLACHQSKLGHAVAIASGGGDFDDLLARHDVETFAVSHRRQVGALVKSALALRRLVRAWRPDVVHAHMMTSAVLAWPICRTAGVALVTTVHNEFEKSAVLMGLGTRVIAVSNAVGLSMQRRGIPKAKLRVVLNGTIGSARSEERSAEPVNLLSPSILFVGGLHPRKGLADLFAAFDQVHRQHPLARLHIVGSGPFGDAFKETVARLDCRDAVRFEGSQSDPSAWMQGADIFVLPSHADPAPLVLSEARAAGCAVVATQVDGIPELLEHGEAGILVPPRDPQALAAALSWLIEAPERIALWKTKSQHRIEQLTMDRVVQQTVEVYEDAASHVGRKPSPPLAHARPRGLQAPQVDAGREHSPR